MKKKIKIKTISQWHILNQINIYLKKDAIPQEVLTKLYHLLSSKVLGKNGYAVVCIKKTDDDYLGIMQTADVYPDTLSLEDNTDKITVRTSKNKIKPWYITYATLRNQKIRIAFVYRPKSFY